MNIINVKINFTKGTCDVSGINLVEGDYNSTKIVFNFDREDGRKIFEMKSPSEQLAMVQEIENNEIELYGLKDVTTTHNSKTYIEYSKEDAIYWYQPTDNKLFDSEWAEVSTFDLSEYTKVQDKVSLFTEEGYYIFEVSLYVGDSKLTSTKGKIKVKAEQVPIDGEYVEYFLPIFDQIIAELNEAIDETNNLDIDMSNDDGVVTATITKKDGTTKEIEVIDTTDYYTKADTYSKDEVDSIQTTIEGEIPTKVSELDNDSEFIDKTVNNLTNYTLATSTGSTIELSINSSTYVMTLNLKNSAGTTISTGSIDLPLETMVVNATYDNTTKSIILTLKNGQTISVPVGDLVSGLQTEITPSNKLASDLVDDTNQTHKFVSQSEKTQITTNATNIAGIKNGTTINSFSGVESALNGKEDKSNKVTSISSSSTDTQYPSAKCVYDSQALQDNEISDLKSENDYLNSIINQLPKVSSQGTILTLNNTIAGRMNIELGTSELEQETTNGKNFYSTSMLPVTEYGITISKNANGDIVLNGTPNYNEGYKTFYTGDVITVEEGTYTLSVANKIAGIGCVVGGFNGGCNLTLNDTVTSKTAYADTPQNVNPAINIRYDVGTLTNFVLNPQMEKGSTATSYEKFTGGIPAPNPSYPMPIHTISGSNKVVVEGKNWFNGEMETGKYDDSTGNKANDNSMARNVSPIYVIPNTTYIISNNGTGVAMNVFEYDKNNAFIVKHTYSANQSFTTGTNTMYINIYKGTANTDKLQIELGNSVSAYTPYVSQEANINLGDIEYCEIGDYKDEFVRDNEGNWGIRKNIGKVVLDGSENWSTRSGATTYAYILADVFDGYNTNGLCNYFKFIKGGSTSSQSNECVASATSAKTLNLFTNNSSLDTVEHLKTWLSTHNLIVYYQLTTPTYTPITGTLAEQLENIYQYLMSYKGQTNISQVPNDLPFNISASALLDLNTLVGE